MGLKHELTKLRMMWTHFMGRKKGGGKSVPRAPVMEWNNRSDELPKSICKKEHERNSKEMG
jgi:hypothetical protein